MSFFELSDASGLHRVVCGTSSNFLFIYLFSRRVVRKQTTGCVLGNVFMF